MITNTLNQSFFRNHAWLARLIFIALLLLLVSCKEHKATGTPTSDLKIRVDINIDDSVPANEATYINVKIYKVGRHNSLKLESGGNVTAHVNGDTYAMTRIEYQPDAPYNYDKHYYYEKRIPHLDAQANVRISINRPSENDAPSSSVRVPEKPVITAPIEGSIFYRSDNIYVSWVPEIYNDTIYLAVRPCSPHSLNFSTSDTGSFTILSNNFNPYVSTCDAGMTVGRSSEGTIDSALNQGTIVLTRYSQVGFSILP